MSLLQSISAALPALQEVRFAITNSLAAPQALRTARRRASGRLDGLRR